MFLSNGRRIPRSWWATNLSHWPVHRKIWRTLRPLWLFDWRRMVFCGPWWAYEQKSLTVISVQFPMHVSLYIYRFGPNDEKISVNISILAITSPPQISTSTPPCLFCLFSQYSQHHHGPFFLPVFPSFSQGFRQFHHSSPQFLRVFVA